MIEFYRSGDLKAFDEYAKLWVKDTESLIDYVCCYTESYGDPLGYKSSWEALINFKSLEATERTKKISDNAQWFEDNSPIDPQFKKEEVKGVSAKVIIAAMCGGDCYPTPPLGINLPNSNWIRAVHGSKSVTIDNISEGRAASTKGSGFTEEFSWSATEVELLNKYKLMTDNLHTDLHECLGHGSGKLAPGVDPDALGAYGAVIEETRADLFGLYYVADQKMVDLGILPDMEAYKAQYYAYIQNGLMTQTTRIKLGDNIEQTHMRNRQLISKWVIEKGNGVVEVKERDGKYFVVVNDYEALRGLFGDLLREIQRIKSTGDFEAAKAMVETYAITIDPELHAQILERYEALNLYPYNGFVNPVFIPSFDENGAFTGLSIDYTEGYAEQHLRYSRDYSFLK
jgi:dipeptidyl-peptidase-3